MCYKSTAAKSESASARLAYLQSKPVSLWKCVKTCIIEEWQKISLLEVDQLVSSAKIPDYELMFSHYFC